MKLRVPFAAILTSWRPALTRILRFGELHAYKLGQQLERERRQIQHVRWG